MKVKTFFAIALLTALTASVYAQVPEKEKVLNTAKDQIMNFVKDLPDEGLADYGFLNKKEFGKIKFDDPIPVYTIEDSTIVFTYTWRVPVVIDNEYRSLLTVVNENGVFKATDFGACGLAKAYETGKTPKTFGMLRVYETKQDFLMEKNEAGNQVLKAMDFNR